MQYRLSASKNLVSRELVDSFKKNDSAVNRRVRHPGYKGEELAAEPKQHHADEAQWQNTQKPGPTWLGEDAVDSGSTTCPLCALGV